MLNLIKADLYKYINRPYIYILNIILVSGIIILGFSYGYSFRMRGAKESLINPLLFMLNFSGIFVFTFSDNIIEKGKYNTIKNIASSDIKRSSIFIGKVITQLILGLITFFICFIVTIIVSYVFDIMPNGGINDFIDVFFRYMVSIPTLLGCISFYTLILLFVKGEGRGAFLSLIVAFIFPTISVLLSQNIGHIFTIIDKYFLMNSLDLISKELLTFSDATRCISAGIINTIIFMFLGILMMKKKDIK
ncbi:hypothetical protein [Clostridium chrysemydis]|uniref:hypothetical protein n=1 Tax=Clostridium chrysemydis TaxID=2665504 RepID=UPI001883AE2A|nr:hypothetical protein [Clostridium chrysemydis]